MLPDEVLTRVETLLEDAMYLRAFDEARPFGHMRRWRSPRALAAGWRLAHHLGASKLSNRLAVQAHRLDPAHPRARVAYAHALLDLRGPIDAYFFALEDLPKEPDARADMLQTAAMAATMLRDFARAEALLDEASTWTSNREHVDCLRVSVLRARDRNEEALAMAEEICARKPNCRVPEQHRAALLSILGRVEEAIEHLTPVAAALESYEVAELLSSLLGQVERHEERRAWIERTRELAPMAEPALRASLEAMLAWTAYRTGARKRAIEHARRAASSENAMGLFADRLADAARPQTRKVLDVPFVRQAHLTCVPAVLASLSRYWGSPADQVEVADSICYDGTPIHSARNWAEQKGFIVREMTITWDAVTALIDRGIPVMIDIYGVVHGHAQIIIGYDACIGSFVVRDPYAPPTLEVVAESLLEQQADLGPHGMVLVPRGHAGLDGITLPDDVLHDHMHALMRSLYEHRRDDALRELDAIPQHHRLHALAVRAIAAYDHDPRRLLAAAEAMAKLRPESQRAEFECIVALEALAPRSEVVERLSKRLGRRDHPVFREKLARMLASDHRSAKRARALLRPALRAPSADAAMTLAMIASTEGREDALDLFRFASCLAEGTELHARNYFAVAQARRRTETALEHLRARARETMKRSFEPSETLHWALDSLHRSEAPAILLEAKDARPNDGAISLALALHHDMRGEIEQAERELERAKALVARVEWLKASARHAAFVGKEPLELWREAVELAPFDILARQAFIARLASSKGRRAAENALDDAARRFPHFTPLVHLRIEWLRDADPARAEQAIRDALAADPMDLWCARELIRVLASTGRIEEAKKELVHVATAAPHDVHTHLLTMFVASMDGRRDVERDAAKKAIAIDADATQAVQTFLDDANEEMLAAAGRDIAERSVGGEGIIAWYEIACSRVDPEVVLEWTATIRNARPESWAAWSISIRQLLACGKEAATLAADACARFPLVPALHIDHARAAANDPKSEIAALEIAARIDRSPNARWMLADALARSGDVERALAEIERARVLHPLDAAVQLRHATLLARCGRTKDARKALRRWLKLEPGDLAAWQLLASLPGIPRSCVVQRAEKVFAEHPWHAGVALVSAMLLAEENPKRAVARAKAAVKLSPRWRDAHHMLAILLAQQGRTEEALAACKPEGYEAWVPPDLEARAAWVHATTGDLEHAIATMSAVLVRQPSLAWGWKCLVDWHGARGDPEARLDAARMLVRATPTSASAHMTLGLALLDTGDRSNARRALERALSLPNADRAEAAELAAFLLSEEDAIAAARPLAVLAHAAPWVALALDTRRALIQNDVSAACDNLVQLACSKASDASSLFLRARRYFLAYGQAEEALRALERAYDMGCSRLAGVVFGRTAVGHGMNIRDKLRREPADEGSYGALAGFCQAHLDLQAAAQLRDYLEREERFLRGDDERWSIALLAWAALTDHKGLVRWASDWKGRRMWPHASVQLALSMRQRDRAADARQVSERAIAQGPSGQEVLAHHAWLALDKALQGHDAGAAEHVKAATGAADVYATIRDLAEAMIALRRERSPARYAEARARWTAYTRHFPYGIFTYGRKLRRRIGLDAGSLHGLVWGWGEDVILAVCAPLGVLMVVAFVGVLIKIVGPKILVYLILSLMIGAATRVNKR